MLEDGRRIKVWRSLRRVQGGLRGGRLAVYVAVVGVLAVIVVPTLAYYRTVLAPQNVWVAQVNGKTIMTVGDLVHDIVVEQMLSAAPSDVSAVGAAPFAVANDRVQYALMQWAGGSLGVSVTPADVEATVRSTFYPQTQAGDSRSDAELEQAYRTAYTNFLANRGVSDADFRTSVEEQLYRDRLTSALAGSTTTLDEWLQSQWKAAGATVRLDSNQYAWVVSKVEAALPRNLATPTPGG